MVSNTANTVGGATDLCGSCDCRRLDVYQSYNVLEQIDQYGNLSNMLMNSQISPIDRAYIWSVLKGTHTNDGTKTGQSQSGSASSYVLHNYTAFWDLWIT